MDNYSFYSAILGLSSSWRILDVTLDEANRDIVLHIRSRVGDKFKCSKCGEFKLPSGVSKSLWLYENQLKIRFYISALVPVIDCQKCGEMKIEIPWGKSSIRCDEPAPVFPTY